MTNQGGVQQAVRDSTGTALDYNGDWSALFDADGIAAGQWSGRMLAWINATLSTSYVNVNEAMQAFAVDQGFNSWSSMNTFSLSLAAALLGAETQGLAIDFTDNTLVIRDTTTPANAYNSTASGKLIYTSPSAKIIRVSGGLLASASTIRTEYDTDGTTPLGVRIEEARTELCLQNSGLHITHQLSVTGGSGSFTDGETVTATGGGTGVYQSAHSTASIFALSGGAGTLTGTLTGGTSGATRTISSAATVWTASNVTTAKTATGPDGAANSATTLTSTAGNGTVLQSITSSSNARITSCWIKRRTGTGTINLTMDNGGTWTAVTVTSAWTSVEVPSATSTNPIVGVRIVTSGDAVDVAYFSNQVGAFTTSPIATTTATVNRAADNITLATSAFPLGTANVFIAKWQARSLSTQRYFAFGKSDQSEQITLRYGPSNEVRAGIFVASSQVADLTDATARTTGIVRAGVSQQLNNILGSVNGATLASADTTAAVPTPTTLYIGALIQNFGHLNTHVTQVLILPRAAVSQDELNGFTA